MATGNGPRERAGSWNWQEIRVDMRAEFMLDPFNFIGDRFLLFFEFFQLFLVKFFLAFCCDENILALLPFLFRI